MSRAVKLAVVLVLLAGTALYVRLNPPRRLALGPETLSAFPMQLGGWSGEELDLPDVVVEELEADDTLARRYVSDDGESVWFVIIFHQNERYGAHEPVVCYRAQGWDVTGQGAVPVAGEDTSFEANWLVAESEGQKRVAVYWWYTAGDLATADRDKFMARMAASGIRSNVTFGAFIRVSAVVGSGGLEEALRTATAFAGEAIPHLPGLFSEEAREAAGNEAEGAR
jgi:EpsI family protein